MEAVRMRPPGQRVAGYSVGWCHFLNISCNRSHVYRHVFDLVDGFLISRNQEAWENQSGQPGVGKDIGMTQPWARGPPDLSLTTSCH